MIGINPNCSSGLRRGRRRHLGDRMFRRRIRGGSWRSGTETSDFDPHLTPNRPQRTNTFLHASAVPVDSPKPQSNRMWGRASNLGAVPNYRALVAVCGRLNSEHKCRRPAVRAIERQACCYALIRADKRDFQKRTVAPTTAVLSIEPPVGSRLWSMPNLLCQYT